MGTTTFAYDWANRETTVTPPTAYTTSTVTRTYRVDGTLDTQAFGGSVTETLSYSYDGLGRVGGSSGLSPSSTYSYDLDSDRLTRVDGTSSTTFTYDWTGEPYQQTISGTTKTFASDRYGNLTTAWDKASASITYAYDEASRLTGITPQTGSAATLTPDALDRSKSRVVGSTTDTYGYAGPSTTSYETGSTTKTDALLDVDGSRLAVKTGSTLSWVIFDLHGSIVALCLAGSTSLSDAYRYDAWGQAIGTNPGSATNPWRYRGLLDLSPDANPILSMGARFYSPSLGSFTQEDSVQGQAANPLSMNRYLYAEANPATLIDPDGHGVYCGLGEVCTAQEKTDDLRRLATYQQKQQAAYAASHPNANKPYCSNHPAECNGVVPPRPNACRSSSCGGPSTSKRPLQVDGFNLPDPTDVETTGGCISFTVAAIVYLSSSLCSIVDAAGERALAISNGTGKGFIGGVSITGGTLYSNGSSIRDQAGPFNTFDASGGIFVASGGFSTASGTNDAGRGINTTIVGAGPGAGLPVSASWGTSTTTVLPLDDIPSVVRVLLGLG